MQMTSHPKEHDVSGLVRHEHLSPRPHSVLSDVSSISVGRVNPAFVADNASMRSVSIASSQLGIRSNTPVVLTRTDGSKVIIAPNRDHRDLNMEEPELRQRRVSILKILSVLSIFLFFPTGIAAVVCAWRCEREFLKGVQSGDQESARKYSKWTERLVIFSLVCGVVMWALIAALIERVNSWENNDGDSRGVL
ncbi:hypothetical protein CAPTEDRAFT_208246 [Capitella teleta]|uniref:Uncharacterized protein n=1 Tax=Capitella teleta TaxID=283909 RepID=R7TQF0_CAPTE|nr:hypothetical protein CAPTEDRAFT_208246 [Capitella teleta]|eukprot:ELT96148.1 hypothetical protein CAPTEDRAFT_208246 [Capitella teleta]